MFVLSCDTATRHSRSQLNDSEPVQTLQATTTFNGHSGVVEDVAWHCSHPTIFGSCGDDKKLVIWDLRSPQPQKWSEPHTAEVNCVAFNPMEEWLLATGSADKSVVLHDMRMLHQRLHVMDAHREEVFQVCTPAHHNCAACDPGDFSICQVHSHLCCCLTAHLVSFMSCYIHQAVYHEKRLGLGECSTNTSPKGCCRLQCVLHCSVLCANAREPLRSIVDQCEL